MKKLLSLILAMAVAFSMISVVVTATGAEQADTLDITSISNGDVFSATDNIALTVDATGLEDVTCIDFYANGDKLPGTVAGNEGTLIWYAPTAGLYEITTKINYVSGAEVPGSDKVNIKVKDNGFGGKQLFKAEDIAVWTATGFDTPGELVDDYGVLSNKSFKIYPKADSKLALSNYANGAVGAGRTYWFIYSEIADADVTVEFSYATVSQKKTATLKKGWNVITPSFNKNNALSSGYIYFSEENTNLTGEDAVYIGGIVEGTTGTAPTATPVIANGATSVCPALDSYRIEFDKAIIPALPDDAVTVKDADGNAVSGVTFTSGWDYIDVDLSAAALANDKEYTVALKASTVAGYEGKFVAASSFTFTTKDSECANATPVVKMTYPENGETVLGDSIFAAQIAAGSSAIKKVKFYNGTTELGEGTINKNGECWFKPSTALTAGTYTISAKFLQEDGATEVAATDAITVEVIDRPEYYLRGLADGDIIIAEGEPLRTVQVIDSDLKITNSGTSLSATKLPTKEDSATLVSKVEFYVDNELVGTALSSPYKFALDFDNYGTHNLKVKVYDLAGNITNLTGDNGYTYTVKKGEKIESELDTQNFDELTAVSTASVSTTDTTNAIESGALKVSVTGSNKSGYISLNPGAFTDSTVGQLDATATDLYRISFKYKHTLANSTVRIYFSDTSLKASGDTIFNITKNFFQLAKDKVYEISLVLDLKESEAISYIDGVEYFRTTLTTGKKYVNLRFNPTSTASCYIDDYRCEAYKIDDTQSFGTSQVAEYTNLTGSEVSVTTKAVNTTDASENLVNIIAVYTGDEFKYIAHIDPITYAKGDFKSKTYNVPLRDGANKVRVFTWNGLAQLVPVGVWGN